MEDEEGGGARTAGSPLLWKLLMMAKGKPRLPQLWPAARGLGPILLPPPRTRGKHTKHTLVTRKPDWGGGGRLQPSPRPQGTYLGLLRGEGLLPLLVRVDEAAQSRRNWKRRRAQRLPPPPCVPAPTPSPAGSTSSGSQRALPS